MTDDLNKLTPAQRDALASAALKQKVQAKKRAAEYRDRKKGKGLVQVSVWVPEDKAEALRKAFQAHVDKVMAQSAAKSG